MLRKLIIVNGSFHWYRSGRGEVMIPYQIYKIVHFTGIFMVLMSLSAVSLHVINGGHKNHKMPKPIMIVHGVGLFFILLGGFGLLARIGVQHGSIPAWAWGKIGIWLLFGAMSAIMKKFEGFSRISWLVMWILAGTAASLALYKP